MAYEPGKAYEVMKDLVRTVAPQISVPEGFLPKLQEYAVRLPTYATKEKAQEGLGTLLKEQHIPDNEAGKLLKNVLGAVVDTLYSKPSPVPTRPPVTSSPTTPDYGTGPTLGKPNYPKGTRYAVVSPKQIRH